MRSRFAGKVLAISSLWALAYSQLSSLPTKENFLRRAFHKSVIRKNFLYIDGGELNQIDNSSGTPTAVVNTQNTTLSIDLRSSWTNDSVVLNSIDKGNAPVLNEEWLWKDPDGKTFYVWGGGKSPLVSRPDPGQTLWAFTADGKGGGQWTSRGKVPSSLIRTSNALVTSSTDGIGYAIGGNAPDPVQGMVSYDMSLQTWRNASTVDLSNTGTAVDGQLIDSILFGQEGILIALDGSDGTTGESASLNDFSLIKIYDRASGQWLEQATTGTPPEARITFCAVTARGESSLEIFIYGGFGGFSPLTTYDDVHVLSLPSFSWYKADYTPGVGRTLHTCNGVKRQMIVVGGTSNDDSWLTGDSVTGTYKDPWPWGLGVFDMSSMQWTSQFDADADDYVTPDVVKAGIAANGSKPAKWSSSAIETVFSHTTLNQTSTSSNSSSSSSPSPSSSSGSTSKSSSGISGGAIAGIVVATVAVILIVIGALLCIRRSKRRNRGGHNPYPNDPNAYPMKHTDAGKHSPASQAPLVEIGSEQTPEKHSHVPAELNQPGTRQYIDRSQAHEKMGTHDDGQWRHELA